MNKINYQKELEKVISTLHKDQANTLLLHSCCAPCSSYCMELLREYFDITVFYYNPNISALDEYKKRAEEERRLIAEYNKQVNTYQGYLTGRVTDEMLDKSGIDVIRTEKGTELVWRKSQMKVTASTRQIKMIDGDYIPEEFYSRVKGLEKCKEGGARCFACYGLRIEKSFEKAAELGCRWCTTTLSISPLKNAEKINEIGKAMENSNVKWLPSDFKKKEGYKRSIILSREFELYRQNFCGCVFSSFLLNEHEIE